MNQYKNCGHFYVNFVLTSDENTNFDVVKHIEYLMLEHQYYRLIVIIFISAWKCI